MNPMNWASGALDRQIAARHGLPDVNAMKTRGITISAGQSPFAGNNRLGLLFGQKPHMNVPAPGGMGPPHRVPTPMLGKDQSREFMQGFHRATAAPTIGNQIMSNLPVLTGAGLDAFNWMRGR
jgi:hypothetical protein